MLCGYDPVVSVEHKRIVTIPVRNSRNGKYPDIATLESHSATVRARPDWMLPQRRCKGRQTCRTAAAFPSKELLHTAAGTPSAKQPGSGRVSAAIDCPICTHLQPFAEISSYDQFSPILPCAIVGP